MSTMPAWLSERREPRSRAFLSPHPLRKVTHDGREGVLVRVRLTSYRSLPLSCLESLTLAIDGQPIDPNDMLLLLGGRAFRLSELAQRSDVWWFILDSADLFVATKQPLAEVEHVIEGTLVTVEPYMTAGRFSFHHEARVVVPLAQFWD